MGDPLGGMSSIGTRWCSITHSCEKLLPFGNRIGPVQQLTLRYHMSETNRASQRHILLTPFRLAGTWEQALLLGCLFYDGKMVQHDMGSSNCYEGFDSWDLEWKHKPISFSIPPRDWARTCPVALGIYERAHQSCTCSTLFFRYPTLIGFLYADHPRI